MRRYSLAVKQSRGRAILRCASGSSRIVHEYKFDPETPLHETLEQSARIKCEEDWGGPALKRGIECWILSIVSLSEEQCRAEDERFKRELNKAEERAQKPRAGQCKNGRVIRSSKNLGG